MWTFHKDEVVAAFGFEPCAGPDHQEEWARAWALALAFGHSWAHEIGRPENLWGPTVMSMEDDGCSVVPPVPIHWVRQGSGEPMPARVAQAWVRDRDGAVPSLSHRTNNGRGRYEWRIDGSATHLWVHRPAGVALEATVRDGRIESLGTPGPFRLRHVRALQDLLTPLGVDDAELLRAWTRHGMPWLRISDLSGEEMRSLLLDAGMRPSPDGHLQVNPAGDGFEIVEIVDNFSPEGEYLPTRRQTCRLVWTDEDRDDLDVVLVDENVQVDMDDLDDVQRAVSTALQVLPLVSMRWED